MGRGKRKANKPVERTIKQLKQTKSNPPENLENLEKKKYHFIHYLCPFCGYTTKPFSVYKIHFDSHQIKYVKPPNTEIKSENDAEATVENQAEVCEEQEYVWKKKRFSREKKLQDEHSENHNQDEGINQNKNPSTSGTPNEKPKEEDDDIVHMHFDMDPYEILNEINDTPDNQEDTNTN